MERAGGVLGRAGGVLGRAGDVLQRRGASCSVQEPSWGAQEAAYAGPLGGASRTIAHGGRKAPAQPRLCTEMRAPRAQRPARATHARRAPAQHHLCTEIRAPRAQRSTSATRRSLASSETLLRNFGRLSEIDIYIYIYIYISPNYFSGCVERSKIPWLPLGFCGSSRAVWRFSVGKTNTIDDLTPKVTKVPCFTVHFAAPPRAGRIRRPLSRIRAGRSLRHGKGATRRKRRRQNTVLSDRRLRRSRARGAADFRNCQHYRGSGVSDGEIPANLRNIWDARFWSC